MNNPRRERLVTSSFGLLFWAGLRKITKASGYRFLPSWGGRLGRDVAVWGRVPRAERMVQKYRGRTNILTFEDAFLRSVIPGPKTPPLGITVDRNGVHFDGATASDLETLLQTAPLDDLSRARDGIEFLRHYGLSKYNQYPRGYGANLDSGYVLVVDQVSGDASIRYGGASDETFADMLAAARVEHPDKAIIIRTHPATTTARCGHYSAADSDERTMVLDEDYNPWDLLENAAAVYCVTSLLGFEAILAGKRPTIFGTPFYAGWGLSDDRQPIARRTRNLSVEQLFHGVMIDYPIWFDRASNQICGFEDAAYQLLAEARHFWDGRQPSVAVGMRLWKRRHITKFLSGGDHHPRYQHALPDPFPDDKTVVAWANKVPADTPNITRMEDGFLRSSGLGAELTPPMSLVLDDVGIYYNPTGPSGLEQLIAASAILPDAARNRAAALRGQIIESGVTKYNLSANTSVPDLPKGQPVILVPGQIEDDASILTGTSEIKTNAALLCAARAANPDAYIIYKPHPDTEANLRDGGQVDATHYDFLAAKSDPNTLIALCDEVWTMTSLMGFEALLREKNVTCLGMPFYAGWGLTDDRGQTCPRRAKGISLDGLVHAALIDYPRYLDPVSGLPCPPELAVARLAAGQGHRRPVLRSLAKLQSWFSNFASIWR